MSRFLLALFATVALCPLAIAETPWGAGLSTESTAVRIGQLAANPEQYVDQQLRIEGLVDDICPMKGCWVDVLESGGTETVRIKVQDDVIVFPAEARGEEIIAEGVWRRYEMNERQARRHLRHLAAEKGEDFDPRSHSGPLAFYQLEGTGGTLDLR